VYPETAAGRDIMFWHSAIARGKLPKVDVVIRAHGHYHMELHKEEIRYIMLPCWQWFVPYDKALKYFSKFQPDIGGYLLLFDDKLRMSAWHFIYPNITEDPKEIVVQYKGEDGAPLLQEDSKPLKKDGEPLLEE